MHTYKLAFAGLRHGHILGMYDHVKASPRFEIVAACEEDGVTRKELLAARHIQLSHDSFDQLLNDTDCDIIAIGDYYGKRGGMVLKALRAGKHVIVDKPVCTELNEWIKIFDYVQKNNLSLGCMLDLRDMAPFLTARDLIQKGSIGELQAVQINGQHPLTLDVRPHWYFEPGKHGGTINDLAIHAVDLIPWITGLDFNTVLSARSWNAFLPQYPHFKDAAQFLAVMNNQTGLFCDVSYMVPDGLGYSHPLYWRITFWGREGVLETSCTSDHVQLATSKDSELNPVPLLKENQTGYLTSFVNELDGNSRPGDLTTKEVIRAGFLALKIQNAADENLFDVKLKNKI